VKLIALFSVLSLVGCIETACPTTGPGKPTTPTVQADVRVALDTCTEDRKTVSGNGEFATLACSDGGAGGVFRILFPRKQWQSMKQDGVGLVNAGPGK